MSFLSNLDNWCYKNVEIVTLDIAGWLNNKLKIKEMFKNELRVEYILVKVDNNVLLFHTK